LIENINTDNLLLNNQEILKNLFSHFYLVNSKPIINKYKKNKKASKLEKVFPIDDQIKDKFSQVENNESNQLLFQNKFIELNLINNNKNNNSSFNNCIGINNDNNNDDNNDCSNQNLYNIINNLIIKNPNKDINDFELIGEFQFNYDRDLFSFYYWIKNKNLNDLEKNISNQSYENFISKNEEENFLLYKNDLNEDEIKPLFFLVYYIRNNNNIIDIIIKDITNIRKIEKEALKNKSKKNALIKIAHEFKTPLITIIGQIDKVNEIYFSKDHKINV